MAVRNDWQSIALTKSRQRVRKYIGKHPITGKRITVSRIFSAKEKKSNIRDWIAEERTKFGLAPPIPNNSYTLKSVFDMWFERNKSRWRSTRTAENYKSLFKNHCGSIANKPIQRIKRPDITAMFSNMATKNYSDSVINKVFKLLKQVFSWAVDSEEILARNPLPKFKYVSRGAPVADKVILSREESRRFMDECEGERFEVLFSFLLVTGVRIGEALALRWDNVTSEGIVIDQSLENITGGFEPSAPKSKSAYRTIPIPDTLRSQLENLGKNGRYVFSGDGHNYYTALRRDFKRILKTAGLNSTMRIHDLRHTACTLMLMKNMNPKVVSTLLGHSDVAFTLNTYAHYIPEWGENIPKALESIYFSHTVHTQTASGAVQHAAD